MVLAGLLRPRAGDGSEAEGLGLPSWLPLGHIWAGPPPRTQPWEATLFPPHLGHGGEGRAAPEGHRQAGGRQLCAQQAPGQPHPCTQSEASPVGDKAHPTASDHSGSEKHPRASPPAAQLPQLPLHQCRPRASSSSSEDRLSSSVSKSCCQKNVFNSFDGCPQGKNYFPTQRCFNSKGNNNQEGKTQTSNQVLDILTPSRRKGEQKKKR